MKCSRIVAEFVVDLNYLYSMIKLPTTKLVLSNDKKVNGSFPVKLRVTYNRRHKFYPCNRDLTKEVFGVIFGSDKLKRNQKEVKDILTGIEAKAVLIIADLKPFEFNKFENKFYERVSGEGDVYDLINRVHTELMDTDRIGSASLFKTLLNSLKFFRTRLTFQDITTEFLYKFEKSLLDSGPKPGRKPKAKKLTSVGIYMRHLRSIYNRGISENLVAKEQYPFGRNKYMIPTGSNIKKALTLDEVAKIFNYQTSDKGWERKAKDFWIFSYLCNGMNIMDIAKLKYKDIYNGEIHYERSKTIRSNRGRSGTVISIPILPHTQKIIETWGTTVKLNDDFIFPILVEGMSAIEVKRRVGQFTKNMNDYTKKIAVSLGIEKTVTTYVARHSYATVLKRSGATTEAISENLGHSNINTTKSYLDSFESESRKKTAQALVAFDLDRYLGCSYYKNPTTYDLPATKHQSCTAGFAYREVGNKSKG